MTDLLDKRLTDIETIVWEFPNLINTRFERFDVETASLQRGQDSLRLAISDLTARVVQVERILGALQIDMRDMRAGITRHMLSQSKRMDAVEAGQARLEAGQAKLEAGQAKLEAGQAAQAKLLEAILARLPPLKL